MRGFTVEPSSMTCSTAASEANGGKPVRVMLPLRTTTEDGTGLIDGEGLSARLEALKSVGAQGVMADVWWGVVESRAPRCYEWRGYLELVQRVARVGMTIDLVLSFHACGDSVGDGETTISLPAWAIGENARENMYADKRGTVTEDYLSLWGDETRDVRRGDRSPLECYGDFMREFKRVFEHFLTGRAPTISQVIIGTGPCGELRYPSYRTGNGWFFPGTGEFQSYDERARMSLAYEAAALGRPEWGRHPPADAPNYNCDPEGRPLHPPRASTSAEDEPHAKRQHTLPVSTSASSLSSASFSYAPESASRGFFATDGTGSWDTPYGKFFLTWYSRELVAHGERVLEIAIKEFAGVDSALGIKLAGIHWWHNHPSRAAQCAAGYYNAIHSSRSMNDISEEEAMIARRPSPGIRKVPDDDKPSSTIPTIEDERTMLSHEPRGYAQIVDMCARFGVELTFTCVEMRDTEHDPSHMCSPEGLLDQVLRTAAARGVKVHGENALSRFDTEAFSHILSAYGRGGDCDEAGAPLSAKSASGSVQSSFSADDTVMLMDAASVQDALSDSNVSAGAYADALKSFTYLRADDELFEPANFARFANFVKRMSGLPN